LWNRAALSAGRRSLNIADIVEALVQLTYTDDAIIGSMNLGDPQEIGIQELAELVLSLTGSRSPIEVRPLPKDASVRRCLDLALAEGNLGRRPSTGLTDEFRKTIACFAERSSGS